MHKTVLRRGALLKLRRPSHSRQPADSQPVHFHQGPQGQPVPCYDARCTSPHLDV
jgi:hypothetical protein